MTRQTKNESAVRSVDTAAITGETPQWMLLYMRTGSVVVCAVERNQAITTSSNEIRNANSAPATIEGTICGRTTWRNRQVAIGGQMLELQGLGGVYSEIFLPLHGEHQAHNAAIALAAVEAFFGAGADRQLDIDAVRAGFAAAVSPGRMERMRSAPTVFIDAAHNPAGATALAQTLAEEFDFRFLVGIVAVMAEKDVDGILAALEPVLDQIVVTTNGSPRALDVESLAMRAEERFGPERVIAAAGLPDAIETATALVEEVGHDGEGLSGSGVVITGSVVTAGVARTLFGRDPE